MAIALLRELEKELYELVDIIRFDNGRRYIYRLIGEREYFVHVLSLKDATYIELWLSNFAVPLLVFKIVSMEEFSRVLILLKSLAKVL